MPDPTKVKPVKAAGGPLSADDLDRYEVLLAVGGSIPTDEIQRLIETLRVQRAAPSIHEADTQRIRPIRREAPPKRQRQRRRRTAPPVVLAPERHFDWHSILMALIVAFIAYELVSKKAMPELIMAGIFVVPTMGWLFASRRRLKRRLREAEVSRGSSDSLGYEPDDDEEDEDDAAFQYRQERWQGDNDLNGRNYSGRAL